MNQKNVCAALAGINGFGLPRLFPTVTQRCKGNNLDIWVRTFKINSARRAMKHMLMQSDRIEFHTNVGKSISDYHSKNFIFIDL
jgi:tRNA A-37 threonylcarbamoyl transferase component Bud32